MYIHLYMSAYTCVLMHPCFIAMFLNLIIIVCLPHEKPFCGKWVLSCSGKVNRSILFVLVLYRKRCQSVSWQEGKIRLFGGQNQETAASGDFRALVLFEETALSTLTVSWPWHYPYLNHFERAKMSYKHRTCHARERLDGVAGEFLRWSQTHAVRNFVH